MSLNMAVLVAPLFGGAVYAVAGYCAVFYVSFGLIALDVVLRLGLIEKKDGRKWISEADSDQTQRQFQTENISPPTTEDMEKQGAKDVVLVEKGTTSLATATNRASTENPVAETPQAKESRSSNAPIFSLLRSPRVLTALFGCLVQSTLFSTFDTVLPLHVNALFGWGSLGSGLIFLGLLVPSLASPLVGWSNDKLGPKWIACIGFLLCFPALVLLREVTHGGIGQILLLCALLVIMGFGVNFIAIPLSAEISYAIEANEKSRPGLYGAKGAYAQGYALLNTGFAMGGLIGPVWSGYVVNEAGWETLGWSLGLLCALTTIPIVIWTGGKCSNETNLGISEEESSQRYPS